MTYLIYSQPKPWMQINQNLTFTDCYKRPWYRWVPVPVLGVGWFIKTFNEDFHLALSNKTVFSPNDVYMYLEKHDKKKVVIHQLKATDCNSITEDEINDVDCFKANKNLKFLYVETLSDGTYKLKANLDLAKVKDESWPRQSEFTLTASDIDDIIDFCEDHALPKSGTELSFSQFSDINKEASKSSKDLDIEFYGDTLRYKVHHSDLQNGYYLRFVFSNNLQVVYKYDDDPCTFMPYMVYDGKSCLFANSEAKNEYLHAKQADKSTGETVEDSSWWNGTWSTVSGWFTTDSKSNDKTEPETSSEKPSWWSGTWSTVSGWFTTDSKSDDKTEPETSSEKPSWWSKTWSTVGGWFSSDDEEKQVDDATKKNSKQ